MNNSDDIKELEFINRCHRLTLIFARIIGALFVVVGLPLFAHGGPRPNAQGVITGPLLDAKLGYFFLIVIGVGFSWLGWSRSLKGKGESGRNHISDQRL